MSTEPKISVMSSALSDDPRTSIAQARQLNFAGIVFDAKSKSFDLTELSSTGRREFRHLVSSHALAFVGVRTHLLPHGFTGTSDVDRILSNLEKVIQVVHDLGAQTVQLDLGPLPARDEAIFALAAIADSHGLKIALSSSLSSFESLDALLKLAKCPWFGVDLDTVAVQIDAWNVDEIFSRLGKDILHVRARDALVGDNRRTQPIEIGNGSVKWNDLLSALEGAGYRGWLSIDPTELANRAAGAVAGLKFFMRLTDRR